MAKLCDENEVFLKFLGRSLKSQLEWVRLKNRQSVSAWGFLHLLLLRIPYLTMLGPKM